MTPGKEQLNRWSLREYVKHSLMILIKVPVWCAQWLLFWVPLKENRIIIYSMKQRGFACNLKYLTQFLMDRGGYEILWVVRSGEECAMLAQRGIRAVTPHSREHFVYRHRAAIVITNDEFYPMCRKRRGQQYVNTWHGAINYKKIGYDGLSFTNPIQKLIYRMNNPCPDVFLSGSRSFTDTASASFRFPRETFLECGLPRNDILVNGVSEETLARLKSGIGIPAGKRAVLYAPTFRKGKAAPPGAPDFDHLTRSLGKRFGGEWVVLLRQHYFVASEAPGDELVIDVSGYEDMQELILVSDCMISDYSSVMWDFSLTGKPCFIYAEDLEEYRSADRSFFIPPECLPYPMTTDSDTLCKAVEEFDIENYARTLQEHMESYGSYDRGTACKTLADYLDCKEK